MPKVHASETELTKASETTIIRWIRVLHREDTVLSMRGVTCSIQRGLEHSQGGFVIDQYNVPGGQQRA